MADPESHPAREGKRSPMNISYRQSAFILQQLLIRYLLYMALCQDPRISEAGRETESRRWSRTPPPYLYTGSLYRLKSPILEKIKHREKDKKQNILSAHCHHRVTAPVVFLSQRSFVKARPPPGPTAHAWWTRSARTQWAEMDSSRAAGPKWGESPSEAPVTCSSEAPPARRQHQSASSSPWALLSPAGVVWGSLPFDPVWWVEDGGDMPGPPRPPWRLPHGFPPSSLDDGSGGPATTVREGPATPRGVYGDRGRAPHPRPAEPPSSQPGEWPSWKRLLEPLPPALSLRSWCAQSEAFREKRCPNCLLVNSGGSWFWATVFGDGLLCGNK